MIKSNLPPVYAIQNADGTYWGAEGAVTDVNNAILHRTPEAAGKRLEFASKKVAQAGGLKAQVVEVEAFIHYRHVQALDPVQADQTVSASPCL